ncbi:MAG TPA: hypothetical protein VFI02_18095 [Armatimonadota bacterium]|nr:hypothetical protein [Armatimonadota bacterium]
MKKWLVVILGVIVLAAHGLSQTTASPCCTESCYANLPKIGELLPSDLQTELVPYLASSAKWSKDTGLPLVRPLCADFPNDEETASVKDEYMVGPALLVALGSSSRDIYLPLARWYDYWTGRVIGGGRSVHFDEAEGPVPIYVRGSSIIPTAETGTSNLIFRIYAGYAPATCTLCPEGGKGCSLRAYRTPNGMEVAVNPGTACPVKTAMFVINLPYRTVAGVAVDGQTLAKVSADQLASAAQGWNQEGTIVQVKVPVTKRTLIRISYAI